MGRFLVYIFMVIFARLNRFGMQKLFFFTALLLLFYSCGHTSTQKTDENTPDSTLTLTYATGFSIDYFRDYKRVTVFNPWEKSKIWSTYYLVSNDSVKTPDASQTLQIPLSKLAVTSCTHFEFLKLLDELHTITGVCSPELIYNETIAAAYANGEITSLGDAFNTNVERLLMLKPDALMLASYNQQDENAKRLQAAGVPLLFNNEWTEKSLLARAEWIKFIAVFYNKETQACDLFDDIETNYNDAKRLAQAVTNKPLILTGGNFKGTWYMPGGQSYMARLFVDAGADYLYANDTTTGSLPLNFETVLNSFSKADVWLNAPVASMPELINMDERHKLFTSAQQGEVYGFWARTKPSGANDFWESAIVHPDLVLKDVIWALHPSLLPDYEPVYIIRLKTK